MLTHYYYYFSPLNMGPNLTRSMIPGPEGQRARLVTDSRCRVSGTMT